MQEEFLFSGFGGQGVMFVGQLLAHAAMDEGLEVAWIPSYGPEIRGGTAHCFVVLSDRPIGSPLVRQPRFVVAFNGPSLTKYESIVAPGGLLARNSSMTPQSVTRTDITELVVPATETAYALGNARLANMVMLGAVLSARPVIAIAAVRRALEAHLPARHRELLELNFEALERGAEFVPAHR